MRAAVLRTGRGASPAVLRQQQERHQIVRNVTPQATPGLLNPSLWRRGPHTCAMTRPPAA